MTNTFRNQVITYQTSEKELITKMTDVAKKLKQRNIFIDDYQEIYKEQYDDYHSDDDDNTNVNHISLDYFDFHKYQFQANHVRLDFRTYVGCGDYDIRYLTIPYEVFDDIDKWIDARLMEQNTFISPFKNNLIKERDRHKQQELIEQEKLDREQYLKLKEKYND